MAGHSHSANVKRRKDSVDQKRGKVFSKIARVIISAARQGGGDPDQNLKLKYAIEAAKAANMPKDTIERAVKKGAGGKDSEAFEELLYEGYAPGGVALLVSCLTDNRKRTAPDIKFIFDRAGGNLGTSGSVSFLFDSRAILAVERGERDEESLTELALAAGADDVEVSEDSAIFYAAPENFFAVQRELEGAGVAFLSAELGYIPQNTIPVESKEDAKKILRLIEALEDNDDVQHVYANYEIPDAWLAELG